jgi:hypothetical protein
MTQVRGMQALVDAQLALVESCHRELAIRANQLPSLPQSTDFIDALMRLVKNYRSSRIRVLYNDPGEALEQGHLLILLRRRLTSHVFLRQCDECDTGSNNQWWVGDRFALLTQADEAKPLANLDLFAKAQGPAHLETFEEAWQRGKEDPRLKEIFI